jgi:hypothetical protein
MKIVVECAKMAFQIKTHRTKRQCLEGGVRHALLLTNKSLPRLHLSRPYRRKDRDLKKIIPLYTFGALANAYTEDTFYEADKVPNKEGGKKIILSKRI